MNTYKRLRFQRGGREPRKIVTDKLGSYGVAHRELMTDVIQVNSEYANMLDFLPSDRLIWQNPKSAMNCISAAGDRRYPVELQCYGGALDRCNDN